MFVFYIYLQIFKKQDASEFTKYLLDCVWETIKYSKNMEYKKDMNHNIDPYFGGLFEYKTQCLTCETISCRVECFTELSLGFTKSANSTSAMISNYLQSEILNGENAYFCDKCDTKVTAKRYLSIAHAPKHLIICLKRFQWNFRTMKRKKIMDWIQIPLVLHLPQSAESAQSTTYVLYASVIHSGACAEFGHYFTIGRHVSDAVNAYNDHENDMKNDSKDDHSHHKWFLFNDSMVSFVDYDQYRTRSKTTDVPYMLFYFKIDNHQQHKIRSSNTIINKQIQSDNDTFDREYAKHKA